MKKQLSSLQEDLDRMERRALSSEKDYETLRHQTKSTPEAHLREENTRLKVSDLKLSFVVVFHGCAAIGAAE